MAFTDDIRPTADELWEDIVAHPMVSRLGDGTLDTAPFEYWVRQDYVYLIDYARVFAHGAASAPTLDHMGTFAELLHETIDTEMDLHRAYAAEFGITEAELEATEPSPTTGSFGDLVAALLPCMWGFNETAIRLATDGMPDDERYAEWVRTYAGEEFSELTRWCKDLMDEVAADATASERDRYRDRFVTSARYEYRFWDAAWNEETWTVG